MGLNHAQLFMHYNEKSGQYNIMFDGRPLLGLPASFRDEDIIDNAEKNQETSIQEIDTSGTKKYVID